MASEATAITSGGSGPPYTDVKRQRIQKDIADLQEERNNCNQKRREAIDAGDWEKVKSFEKAEEHARIKRSQLLVELDLIQGKIEENVAQNKLKGLEVELDLIQGKLERNVARI